MKLTALHEEFLEKARRPMTFGTLPIDPKTSDAPIIAVDKWTKKNDSLVKTFPFRTQDQRNDFLTQLLTHEIEVGHNADMTVTEGSVTLKLQTKDIRQVTELDKEFSKWTDELYKDVVYSRRHDR